MIDYFSLLFVMTLRLCSRGSPLEGSFLKFDMFLIGFGLHFGSFRDPFWEHFGGKRVTKITLKIHMELHIVKRVPKDVKLRVDFLRHCEGGA